MSRKTDRPNIVIMYADDLGFGDLSCYGAERLSTPNLDRLAEEGLLFTEGYATAATCTPSRYSLLTGSYPWRNRLAHILAGDAPMIIPPGSFTLPGMLQQAGYVTGVVGKWHLGLGQGDLDWNVPISATPLDVGFDYSFIMALCGKTKRWPRYSWKKHAPSWKRTRTSRSSFTMRCTSPTYPACPAPASPAAPVSVPGAT